MYDLIFLSILVLPLATVHLAGHVLARGFAQLAPEQQAMRLHRANWIVGIGLMVQIIGPFLALEQWADRMPITEEIFNGTVVALEAINAFAGKWAIIAVSLIVTLGAFALDLLLFYRVSFRLDRLAKGIDGNRQAARQQVRLSLRSVSATLLPIMGWSAAVPFLLQSPWAGPESFLLIVLGYLFTLYSLSPLLIRLGHPTETLPPDHPVTVMARELCRTAGVRVSGIRLLRYGEARIANAMVSGLLPWVRCIYVSDRMLETFTPEEVRAVLAHEIGHVKKMHLWAYLALGFVGVLVMGQTRDVLATLLDMPNSVLPGNLALLLWLGLGFPFFSRIFERQADHYAMALTGDAPNFARALEKLATLNCTVRTTGKGEMFQSHPDIAKRMLMVRSQ